MSSPAIDAFRRAIADTDAAVRRGPRVKTTAKPDAAARAARKIGQVANAVSTLSNPIAAFAKLLTGGVGDDWNAFVAESNASLSGKTDDTVSPDEFTRLVSKFVALRAALVESGYSLPDVTLLQLQTKTASKGSTAFYVGLGVLALLGGVFLLKR